MTEQATFPFGRPSTSRPPRKPVGSAALFVLGVYPSALHVRWTPPNWASGVEGVGPIGALAVDDEPMVFWDGAGARERVEQWRHDVGFEAGDEEGAWGNVSAAGNGTSGQSVTERILEPLGVAPDETWFTDLIDRYFVKYGGGKEQGDAIADRYEPFAKEAGLPSADLPRRPTSQNLITEALANHRDRLRAEIVEASAPTIVTLGDESRRVLADLADEVSGPPTTSLNGLSRAADPGSYGGAGTATVGSVEMQWHALVHPGQRSTTWAAIHDAWISRLPKS